MRGSTRRLVWAFAGAVGGTIVAWSAVSERSRFECSLGSSVRGCDTLDWALLVLGAAFPVAALVLAAMLIVNITTRWSPPQDGGDDDP